ncbi:small ribosomal subunit Rsm22 family protein [Treponema pectinovorum]|uniref:small ribosomal subunit Rsm22 family protein n=1 Tax=Treponema pectinovorum TaxID=164 RepID=UPI003D8B609A
MKQNTTKWYEKASGKKSQNPKNKKLKLEKAKTEKSKENIFEKNSGTKSQKDDFEKNTHSKSQRNEFSRDTKLPTKKLLNAIPMFDEKNIPQDALQILNDFSSIVNSTIRLSKKQQILLESKIKDLSHQLTDERNSRRLGYMNDSAHIAAYINYFMWWNLVRLTRLFSNLPKNSFNLNDGDICLDIGSGPLTVPVALWLSCPELRAKKLTFYVLDLSQNALALGEEIYLAIAAKTLKQNEEPWKIVRIKGGIGTSIKEKPNLITCANVFNEIAQNSEMPSDFLAKKYTQEIESYFEKDCEKEQTVFVVEPGVPYAARLVSLMRDSFIRQNFMPVSPCPHIHSCPMEGRTTANPAGKWCNFAFNTETAPEELLKFSKKANLPKERAVLSYVLSKRSKQEYKTPNDKNLVLRVASDFIRLPELKKNGYYCCSEIGLVMAVDISNSRPENGDLLKVKMPKNIENLGRDKKSGALFVNI